MTHISLARGSIVNSRADAIVNAANSQLLRGSGVCGAIHAAAGPELARTRAEWVREHGPVPAGGAAITPGFRLDARYVIHAVGPVWHGGASAEPQALAAAYRSSIEMAEAQGDIASIAFPSISTGVFGYPVDLAAPVALEAARAALANGARVNEVAFVLFDAETFSAYDRALDALDCSDA